MRSLGLIIVLTALLLQSCGSDSPNRGKPIVLGDPATIVTETDSQYLQDFVADIKPIQPVVPTQTDTTPVQTQATQELPQQTAQPKKEEPKQEPKAAPAPKGNGLKVEFKEITVLIPNIGTRTYKQQDTKKANGATYEITSGTLVGNKIQTGGGMVTKVSQRYQTVIAVKNEMGTLMLESLNRTTDWQTLKGSNNTYNITGLDSRQLQFIKASPAAIKNAVTRSARNKRMSRATEQKWLKAVSRVRNANDKPLVIMLRSVMWKIEGKDANGKPYQKQIRIDIPLK
ncbi:hypothetical protein CAP35_05415 [Chitinophagaceae bacterium IBVUCB1]|nr:hypothetical protein CAP35_05415 [Chitinophagaceae bacterium IBVUCB1]